MSNHDNYNISLSLIPQNIIDNYNLVYNQIDGFLYVRVEKLMYDLFQAGIIAHTARKEYLQSFGYEPATITPGLWQHNKRGIIFILVSDEFGIKYQIKEYSQHLINALQKNMR